MPSGGLKESVITQPLSSQQRTVWLKVASHIGLDMLTVHLVCGERRFLVEDEVASLAQVLLEQRAHIQCLLDTTHKGSSALLTLTLPGRYRFYEPTTTGGSRMTFSDQNQLVFHYKDHRGVFPDHSCSSADECLDEGLRAALEGWLLAVDILHQCPRIESAVRLSSLSASPTCTNER